MTFSINTNNLNNITGFADAKAYYERTAPIGDRSTRPLHWDGKSPDVFYIDKSYDVKGREVYELCYHNTACLLLYANGDIEIDASYESVNTRLFIDNYIPYGVEVSVRRHWQVWTFNESVLCPRQRAKVPEGAIYAELIIPSEKLILHNTKTGWRIDEKRIAKLRTRSIDRVKSKKVREGFESFKAFARMFEKAPLSPRAMESAENRTGYRSWRFSPSDFVSSWYADGIPEEDWLRCVSLSHTDRGTFSLERMMSGIYHHAYEYKQAFKTKKLPWGVVPSDPSKLEIIQ